MTVIEKPGIPRASHSFAIARACSLAAEGAEATAGAAACANVGRGTVALVKKTSASQRTNRFARKYFAEEWCRFIWELAPDEKCSAYLATTRRKKVLQRFPKIFTTHSD